jgi:hypothetical protein
LCLVRVPWAGFINGVATWTAAVAFFNARRTGKKLSWAKTAHAFPTAESLQRTS